MQSLPNKGSSWTWKPYLKEFVGGSPWTEPFILISWSLFCSICMWAVMYPSVPFPDEKTPSFISTIATENDVYAITQILFAISTLLLEYRVILRSLDNTFEFYLPHNVHCCISLLLGIPKCVCIL